jgi:hypothetical protein
MAVNVFWLQAEDLQPHVLCLVVLAGKGCFDKKPIVFRQPVFEGGGKFWPPTPGKRGKRSDTLLLD